MRARNWLGGFPALLRDRRALLGIAIDAALVGAGLAMAAGAIGFAGVMVVEGNHRPDVFGLKYLAIYAQPRRAAKPAGETGPSPEPPALGPSLFFWHSPVDTANICNILGSGLHDCQPPENVQTLL